MDPQTTPKVVRRIGLWGGLAAFVLVELLATGLAPRERHAAAVTLLMAAWWLTEAISIYLTSLLPLLLFPILGVFDDDFGRNLAATLRPYYDPYLFLFMGGMLLAAALQETGLHRRIALRIMDRIGSDPARILIGVGVATAFLSLWISNTATAVLMMPIGLSLLAQLEAQEGRGRLVHYGCAIMLAIAYAANIGGIGTKIGTVPNAVYCGFLERQLDTPVSFLAFLAIGLPFVILFLPWALWVLWRMGRRDAPQGRADVVRRELEAMGPMRPAEVLVLAAFLVAAVLWIASGWITPRAQAYGQAWMPTWGKITSAHVEAAIGMICGLSLLLLSAGGKRPLTWRGIRGVPWATLLLLGGGFTMAKGVEMSGLSASIGAHLHALRSLPFLLQAAAVSFVTVGLSAVASNVATMNVMVSLLGGIAEPGPRNRLLTASMLAASCDFMLPAGTPPNAIVFGSGYVSIPRMVRTGAILDVTAALVVTVWAGWLAPLPEPGAPRLTPSSSRLDYALSHALPLLPERQRSCHRFPLRERGTHRPEAEGVPGVRETLHDEGAGGGAGPLRDQEGRPPGAV